MMNSAGVPLITLLFPLYKSAPFLDGLRKHFHQFNKPGYNIIVSDRHCFDDTIDQLKQEFSTEERFTFISETDQINWVDHFNLLIANVSGRYFSFVFHDDSYPPEYFDVLVSELERKPTAVMSFSHMHVAGDRDWVIDHSVFVINDPFPLSSSQYMKLLYSNRIGVAFRGVFRSATIQNENLLIKQNRNVTQFQDYYWIFALMVRGDFIYTDKTHCTKNFRNEGASGKWDHKQFFKTNRAARKVLYEYIITGTMPLITRIQLCSAVELLVVKVRLAKMLNRHKRKHLSDSEIVKAS